PVLMAGDGEGVVDAAAAGVIDGTETLLYSASFEDKPDELRRALDDDADLLLTDTNRRRARRWSTIRETTGYTEVAGEEPLQEDTSDQRLQVFPDADDEARTVAIQRGVERVAATNYGVPNAYYPESRAAHAIDGDVLTAWRVGRFADVTGERLVIELDEPVTTDHITLVQPLTGARDRFITGATLRFNEGPDVDVMLDDSSRTTEGQDITFDERTFEEIEIEIDETNVGTRFSYGGTSAVGLAEVSIEGHQVDELVRLPVDLPRAVSGESLSHRLVIMVTRMRANPAETERADEEVALARVFEVPDERDFVPSGTGRVATDTLDSRVDEILGTDTPGVRVDSSSRLPGDLAARGSRAFDGNPGTAWIPTSGEQRGQWVEVATHGGHAPLTADRMNMTVIADGRHSVPTRLRLENEAGDSRVVDVPEVPDGDAENGTAEVSLSFEPIEGRRLRLVIEEVRPVLTTDYFSRGIALLPVAITETGIEGVSTRALPAALPTQCRDLVTVDGEPLPMRMVGDAAAAEARRGMPLESCGSTAIRLGAGRHVMRAEDGAATGVDVDRFLFSSGRGGVARPDVALGPAPGTSSGPEVEVTGSGRTSFDVRVEQAHEPFWLVLGQSFNDGWAADVSGGSASSSPTLVDGYANGWYIEPDGDGPIDVGLRWTPQRTVWIGLGLSAAALVLCLVLALRPRRRAAATGAITPIPGAPPA
ncbi:MAG: alpha-(1-_3)-arabinofuranosyltransferase domain-containing protein, partial [Acidimicrobiia bacterium]